MAQQESAPLRIDRKSVHGGEHAGAHQERSQHGEAEAAERQEHVQPARAPRFSVTTAECSRAAPASHG
jgi:hypothetical protein